MLFETSLRDETRRLYTLLGRRPWRHGGSPILAPPEGKTKANKRQNIFSEIILFENSPAEFSIEIIVENFKTHVSAKVRGAGFEPGYKAQVNSVEQFSQISPRGFGGKLLPGIPRNNSSK